MYSSLFSRRNSDLSIGEYPSGFDLSEDDPNNPWVTRPPPSRTPSPPSTTSFFSSYSWTKPDAEASTNADSEALSMASRLSAYFSGKKTSGVSGARRVPAAVAAVPERGNEGRRWSRTAEGGVAEVSAEWASLEALADGLESWPSDTGKPTDLPVTYVPGGNTTRDGDAKANGSNKEVNIFTLDIAQVQLLRHALERGGFVAAMGVGTPRKHRQHWDSRREHAEKGNGGDGGVRGGSHGDGSGRLGPQSRHQEQDHGSINRALSGYEMALCLRVHRLSKGISALRILWGMAASSRNLEWPVDLATFPALQDLRLEGVPLEHVQGLFTMRLQLKSLRFEGAPLVGLGALLAGHSSSSSSPISFATGAVNMPPRSAVSATVAVAAPSFQATSSAVSGTVASPPTSPGRRQKGGGTESLHPSGQEGRGEEEDDETVRPREHVFSRSSRVSSSSEKDPSRDVAGGGGAVVRARRAGLDELAGLELRLGRGTPTLRWSCLEVLSVCRCGLRELDVSLRLLPRVKRLTLSHNRVSKVDCLQDCASLEELDLSFNQIENVQGIHLVLGNLRSLNLRGNRISSTGGLERVFSLQDLDLSSNAIWGLEEAARLSALPLLRNVRLEGNPVEAAERKRYRVSVLSLLYQGRGADLATARTRGGSSGGGGGGMVGVEIALDGELSSKKELGELARLQFDSVEQASLALTFVSHLAVINSPSVGRPGCFGAGVSDDQWNAAAGGDDVVRGLFAPAVSAATTSSVAFALARAAPAAAGTASSASFRQRRSQRQRQRQRQRRRQSEPKRPMDSLSSEDDKEKKKQDKKEEEVMIEYESQPLRPTETISDHRHHHRRRRHRVPAAVESPRSNLPNQLLSANTGGIRDVGSGRGGCRFDPVWTGFIKTGPVGTRFHRAEDVRAEDVRTRGGRRRGSRIVVIEEPDGGGGPARGSRGSGGAGGQAEELRNDSVSFCTVPLPAVEAVDGGGGGGDDELVSLTDIGGGQKDGGIMTKSSTSARRRSSPDPELVPEAVPEALEDGFNDSCFPEGVGKRLPLSLAGGVEKLSRGGWPLASANEGDEGEGDEVLVHDSWDLRSPLRTPSAGNPMTSRTPIHAEWSHALVCDERSSAAAVANNVSAPDTLVRTSLADMSSKRGEQLPLSQRQLQQTVLSTGGAHDLVSEQSLRLQRRCSDGTGGVTGQQPRRCADNVIRSEFPTSTGAVVSQFQGSGVEESDPTVDVESPDDSLARTTQKQEDNNNNDSNNNKNDTVTQSLPPSTRAVPDRTEPESAPDISATTTATMTLPEPRCRSSSSNIDRESAAAGNSELARNPPSWKDFEVRSCEPGSADLGETNVVDGMPSAGSSAGKCKEAKRGVDSGGLAREEESHLGADEGEMGVGVGAGAAERCGSGVEEVMRSKEGHPEEGYRGDSAYKGLLIAEHLELYCRQQVFNGIPYLSCAGEHRPCIFHPSISSTEHHRPIAVFRETALPCLPSRPPVLPANSTVGYPSAASIPTEASQQRRSSRSTSANSSVGAMVDKRAAATVAAAEVVRENRVPSMTARDRHMAEALAAAGMAQTVYRRGRSGEARGVAMGEVTCVVVATGTAVFVLDGVYVKKDTLFSEAPRPRLLMVAPLAWLEGTTIGFRLQKLELHFNRGDVSGVMEAGGRASLVLLTRDRSRTFNILKTLEPLASKARRSAGLPATAVENRDGETLEAIAWALPCHSIASTQTLAFRSSDPKSTPFLKSKPFVKIQPASIAGDDAASGSSDDVSASTTSQRSETKPERCVLRPVHIVGGAAAAVIDPDPPPPPPSSACGDGTARGNDSTQGNEVLLVDTNTSGGGGLRGDTMDSGRAIIDGAEREHPRVIGIVPDEGVPAAAAAAAASSVPKCDQENSKSTSTDNPARPRESVGIFRKLGNWADGFRMSGSTEREGGGSDSGSGSGGGGGGRGSVSTVPDQITSDGSLVDRCGGVEPDGIAADRVDDSRRELPPKNERSSGSSPANNRAMGNVRLALLSNDDVLCAPGKKAQGEGSRTQPTAEQMRSSPPQDEERGEFAPEPAEEQASKPLMEPLGGHGRDMAVSERSAVNNDAIHSSPVSPAPAAASSPQNSLLTVLMSAFDGGDQGSGGSGNGGGGCGNTGKSECGDGAVVVFQLLMQRWELRPWVAAPRTLVATKEQVALMDEDHSNMQQHPPTAAAPPATIHGTLMSQPSFADTSGSVGGVRDSGWSLTTPSVPVLMPAGFPASQPTAWGSIESTSSGEVSDVVRLEQGLGMMTCVDFADLADVMDVRQEEEAPEQVTLELKGNDGRRQWRLQCRTRGSAEFVALTIRRLSAERLAQRRRNFWWHR